LSDFNQSSAYGEEIDPQYTFDNQPSSPLSPGGVGVRIEDEDEKDIDDLDYND